jgi:rhodanese-related sulfurtransferase
MKRVSAREAHALMKHEGYLYLDVRTVQEFDEGRPTGAVNVPWVVSGPSGMVANAAFLEQVERVLGRQSRIVVGCASGVRSLSAATLLMESGFVHVVEQRAGMAGVRDGFGRVRERGWRDEGLPTVDSSAE